MWRQVVCSPRFWGPLLGLQAQSSSHRVSRNMLCMFSYKLGFVTVSYQSRVFQDRGSNIAIVICTRLHLVSSASRVPPAQLGIHVSSRMLPHLNHRLGSGYPLFVIRFWLMDDGSWVGYTGGTKARSRSTNSTLCGRDGVLSSLQFLSEMEGIRQQLKSPFVWGWLQNLGILRLHLGGAFPHATRSAAFHSLPHNPLMVQPGGFQKRKGRARDGFFFLYRRASLTPLACPYAYAPRIRLFVDLPWSLDIALM